MRLLRHVLASAAHAGVGDELGGRRVFQACDGHGALCRARHAHLSPAADSVIRHLTVVAVPYTLPMAQEQLLAGNGMHLEVQSSWMCYVLSNVVFLDDLATPATMCEGADEFGTEDAVDMQS